MKVAVCIVGYRNTIDILQCLEALSASDHAAFEVVICENGGAAAFRDLTAAAPSALPAGQPVRVFEAPTNLGFAGGVNACISAAPDAEAWWILNPDAQPRPGALSAMVERLERGGCDAVGGPLLISEDRIQSYGGVWRPWLARAVSIGYAAPLRPAPAAEAIETAQNYLNGASMLVGRRFLERAGRMREDYFLYCEEVEWCLRAGALGLRLGFAPGGVVLHHGGTSTGNTGALRTRSRLATYLGERNRLLLTRDLFPGRLLVAAPMAAALFTLRYGRALAFRQLGYAFAGWLAGLRNERGPIIP